MLTESSNGLKPVREKRRDSLTDTGTRRSIEAGTGRWFTRHGLAGLALVGTLLSLGGCPTGQNPCPDGCPTEQNPCLYVPAEMVPYDVLLARWRDDAAGGRCASTRSAGTCQGGAIRILREFYPAGDVTTYYFDAQSGALVALKLEDELRTEPCNGVRYWPEPVAYGDEVITETICAPAASTAAGVIVYRHSNGALYQLDAAEGSTPVNLSAQLDSVAAGHDNWINISPRERWLLLDSERFDPECNGWGCLSIISPDRTSAEVIRVNGAVVHGEGFAAISSDGALVVYPAAGGPHAIDLWSTRRSGTTWSSPTLLTAASPYAFNAQPAISADGLRVLFDGGQQPYGAEGTAICEVGTDGLGFRVVLTPAAPPPGLSAGGALHHADYAPDGSIVFEGNWNGERIWRLSPGSTTPQLVNADDTNDNSPCVLPDGRIASLWLGRPGGPATHELKVMTADGASQFMALLGEDVADIGIGCGE